MRTFNCVCGSKLFFYSSHCVSCGRRTVRCPDCQQVSAVEQLPNSAWQCKSCGTALDLCQNSIQYFVCNSAVPIGCGRSLCRYCDLNRLIPDLTVAENLEHWRLIERAKHRVLFDIDRIGFPIIDDDESPYPRLRFDFKAAVRGPVSTGHADGLITIDLAEADSVQREETRVQFGEPHRTLVGHFRHELGHYYWEVCVKHTCLQQYRDIFGDERNPSYPEAQQNYYAQGPAANWQHSFISEYASMHPWEDFAETFNAYLDMVAILSTATHFQGGEYQPGYHDFAALIAAYANIAIYANELSRDVGLLDIVPEVLNQSVVEKLRFIHELAELQSGVSLTNRPG